MNEVDDGINCNNLSINSSTYQQFATTPGKPFIEDSAKESTYVHSMSIMKSNDSCEDNCALDDKQEKKNNNEKLTPPKPEMQN